MSGGGRDSVYLGHLMAFDVVPILTWGYKSRILTANDAFLDLVGYDRKELGTINWAVLTPSEYRSLDEHCLRLLADVAVAPPYVKEIVRKDGERVVVRVYTGRGAIPEEGIAVVLEL